MAPQCDEIFKQKVNECVQHIILQKFTNFHAIRSWNFRIFAMRWWPRFFLRHPVYACHVCVDSTVNSTAADVDSHQSGRIDPQHAGRISHCLSVNNAHRHSGTGTGTGTGTSTSSNRSTSQTLPGFKRWRQMRRQLTVGGTSSECVSDSGRRRCDDSFSQSDSVRCATDLSSRQWQNADKHTQLISNHFCVNCQQLMVSFCTLSFNRSY